jgi:hypothetical protein
MNDDSAKQTASYGQRAASYWSVDGLPEILRGLALLIFGASLWLWRFYATTPWRRSGALISFAGLYLYFFLVERVVLDFLKSRITYPRTGYVRPPQRSWSVREPPVPLSLRLDDQPYVLSSIPPPVSENRTSFWPRTVNPLLAFAVVCLFGGSLLGHWLVPVLMPALAVTLYVVNRRSERPYSWWSALVLALMGLVFLWVDVPAAFQGWLPFVLAGAWLVPQGVYTLVRYLRMNPYRATAEEVKA